MTDQELLKMKRDLENLEKASTRAETEVDLARKNMEVQFGHSDQVLAEKEINAKETELDALKQQLDDDKASIQENFGSLLAMVR